MIEMHINKHKFPINKIFLIIILGILALNIFVNYEKLNLVYKYNTEQIETIFFIHDNIPENSKILVPYIGNRTYLYELLIGYEYVIYNSKQENLYIYIKGVVICLKLKFVVIDTSITNPHQLDLLMNNKNFNVLFENDLNIVLEYTFKQAQN